MYLQKKKAIEAFEIFKSFWKIKHPGMEGMLDSTIDNIFTFYDFPKKIKMQYIPQVRLKALTKTKEGY